MWCEQSRLLDPNDCRLLNSRAEGRMARGLNHSRAPKCCRKSNGRAAAYGRIDDWPGAVGAANIVQANQRGDAKAETFERTSWEWFEC